MLRSMPVRRFKRGFKLGLIKLLIGNKAAGVHLSYVGQGASADLCRRIVDIGHTDILVVTDKALKELGCLLYTSPSPRDGLLSRMPSSA